MSRPLTRRGFLTSLAAVLPIAGSRVEAGQQPRILDWRSSKLGRAEAWDAATGEPLPLTTFWINLDTGEYWYFRERHGRYVLPAGGDLPIVDRDWARNVRVRFVEGRPRF